MKLRDEFLLFLDLETTGTNTERDQVLEIGCVLVEAKTLDRLWQQTDYVFFSDGALDDLMSPFVKEMHEKSGLLQGLRDTKDEPRYTLEATLCNYLAMIRNDLGRSYADVYAPKWIRLAGYSPQFDREFIQRDAPEFAALLSHRMMDVSSLRACAKAWAPQLVNKQEAEHRALADCIAAIEELKVYRNVFGQTDVRLV